MMKQYPRGWKNAGLAGCAILLLASAQAQTTHSVARQWNEAMLFAISNDLARPTVHARNLFHVSAAMYDAWAVYDAAAETYLLGKTLYGYEGCPFAGLMAPPADVAAARAECISHAAYRMLRHRFQNSPGAARSLPYFDSLFVALGCDPANTSVDYRDGSPAALGNYIAACVIDYGLRDYSNETNDYANRYYEPVNPPLAPKNPGNPFVRDLDRWQPLTFDLFIDQSGNVIPGNTPSFLSPEWGQVLPFALEEKDLKVYMRDGFDYWVYHDPGPPAYLDRHRDGLDDPYKWNFALVAIWAAHLDPTDGVYWDISPAGIGNTARWPKTFDEYLAFYDLFEGGVSDDGHAVNPHTQQPYEPQWVPRGDYARVLAEYWADGPQSVTPPGHWFDIFNHVADHPALERRFRGQGPAIDPLEWDIKGYFILGGAMHDAAITAWGIKGWYDYARPISAIRGMAEFGQSSDPNLPNYSPKGLPLVDGYIELVEPGDSLEGRFGQHIGKVKLYTWRGPDHIVDPAVDVAGVGWILAENWWPYQRPTFVTPPFAGYISGHSTYSSAAADVMTMITGDPYFPGGMGVFPIQKDRYLVFEKGPSVDMALQWATYRDASDQTSLSRIWGGIHPPIDDIPGREIGRLVARDAVRLAEDYFNGSPPSPEPPAPGATPSVRIFPNPVAQDDFLRVALDQAVNGLTMEVYDLRGQLLLRRPMQSDRERQYFMLPLRQLSAGMYLLRLRGEGWESAHKFMVGYRPG
jgi:hypothetical protein